MNAKDLSIINGEVTYGGILIGRFKNAYFKDGIVYDGAAPILDTNKEGGIRSLNIKNGNSSVKAGNIKTKGNINVMAISSDAPPQAVNSFNAFFRE